MRKTFKTDLFMEYTEVETPFFAPFYAGNHFAPVFSE